MLVGENACQHHLLRSSQQGSRLHQTTREFFCKQFVTHRSLWMFWCPMVWLGDTLMATQRDYSWHLHSSSGQQSYENSGWPFNFPACPFWVLIKTIKCILWARIKDEGCHAVEHYDPPSQDLPAFLVPNCKLQGHVIESRSCDSEWDPRPTVHFSCGSAQDGSALAYLGLDHVVLRALN